MSKPLAFFLQLAGLVLLIVGSIAMFEDRGNWIMAGAGLTLVVIGGIGFRRRMHQPGDEHEPLPAVRKTTADQSRNTDRKFCPHCGERI